MRFLNSDMITQPLLFAHFHIFPLPPTYQGSSEEDSEDESVALLAELQRIKKERAEQAARTVSYFHPRTSSNVWPVVRDVAHVKLSWLFKVGLLSEDLVAACCHLFSLHGFHVALSLHLKLQSQRLHFHLPFLTLQFFSVSILKSQCTILPF